MKAATANNNVENTGRAYILPSSVPGSNRWYQKGFRRAMALVRYFGKPTLFLTATMNIDCPEVKSCLAPHQTPYDRPDLLCRAFKAKKDELIRDIVKSKIFGQVLAYVAVIEFQKRGAPHVHLLVWIKDFEETPENIDNIISTEIPPLGEPGSQEREFHDLVVKYMVHGPCGKNFNANLGCCKNNPGNECKRHYPRPFSTHTDIGEGMYPDYRRRPPLDNFEADCMNFGNTEKNKSNEFSQKSPTNG